MIAKENFELEWGFVDRTKLGIKHFHFHIGGPDDQHIYFYTYVDASAFSYDTISAPLDYILFGSLLLIFRDDIKEEIKKHSTDEISTFLDNMKKKGDIKPVNWILLQISGNELLHCDRCFNDITQQGVHVSIHNEQKKVLCEECWEKEEETSK